MAQRKKLVSEEPNKKKNIQAFQAAPFASRRLFVFYSMARLNKLRVAAAAVATLLVVAAAVAGVRDIAPRPAPSPPSPPSPPPSQNQRPLIGILAQACHSCPGR